MYIKVTPNYELDRRSNRAMKRTGASYLKWGGVFFLQENVIELCSGVTELSGDLEKEYADEDDIYSVLDIYE